MAGAMYKALKDAKALIAYEKGLLDAARSSQKDREAERKSARA